MTKKLSIVFQLNVVAAAIAILLFPTHAKAQGTFRNLDFENVLSPYGGTLVRIPAETALNGWTGYIDGTPVSEVLFNAPSPIGAAAIILHSRYSGYAPFVFGNFGLELADAQTPQGISVAAIGQIGLIPNDAASLLFLGSPSMRPVVTFDGHLLSTTTRQSLSVSSFYQTDISAFAGKTGELRFQNVGFLDFVQFSATPVPEPVIGILIVLGLPLLFRKNRRRS